MTQRTNAFLDLDRDLRFIPLGVDEPRVLTPGQIRRYDEAGHLFPIDIFSPAEIAEIRAYIDDLLPRALAGGPGRPRPPAQATRVSSADYAAICRRRLPVSVST